MAFTIGVLGIVLTLGGLAVASDVTLYFLNRWAARHEKPACRDWRLMD